MAWNGGGKGWQGHTAHCGRCAVRDQGDMISTSMAPMQNNLERLCGHLVQGGKGYKSSSRRSRSRSRGGRNSRSRSRSRSRRSRSRSRGRRSRSRGRGSRQAPAVAAPAAVVSPNVAAIAEMTTAVTSLTSLTKQLHSQVQEGAEAQLKMQRQLAAMVAAPSPLGTPARPVTVPAVAPTPVPFNVQTHLQEALVFVENLPSTVYQQRVVLREKCAEFGDVDAAGLAAITNIPTLVSRLMKQAAIG